MNCSNCFDIYRKAGKPPFCHKGKCEIEDIAPNIQYNQIIDSYLKFKILDSPGLQKAGEKFLEESGLLDEPELLVLFEQTYQETRNNELVKISNDGKRSRRNN